MPNGRSGGFVIETADLKQLLTAVSETAVVGQLSTGRQLRAASTAELSRCIEECPLERVAVEEQHDIFYIIHISNSPISIWVSVTSESPIFVHLRQRHARWMAEHPGWNEWIGF